MRVLVTVASRHGATWEIGEAITDLLTRRGHLVELTPPQDVRTVDGYDAVVLGSAVYLTQLLASARELVERLGPALRERPLWLFASGLASPASGARTTSELDALAARLDADDHRLFRGKLDRAGLSFAERVAAAGVLQREGDHRDFAAIERWAATIGAALDRPAEQTTHASA